MALIQVKKCSICGAEIMVPPSAREVECKVCGSTYDIFYGARQALKKHAVLVTGVAIDAQVKDEEMKFTINKAEAHADIIRCWANRPGEEEITEAYPGEEIGVMAYVGNVGSEGWIWIQGIDEDTGRQIVNKNNVPFGYQDIWPAGYELGWGLSYIIMPDRDFRIRIEAGHGKKW